MIDVLICTCMCTCMHSCMSPEVSTCDVQLNQFATSLGKHECCHTCVHQQRHVHPPAADPRVCARPGLPTTAVSPFTHAHIVYNMQRERQHSSAGRDARARACVIDMYIDCICTCTCARGAACARGSTRRELAAFSATNRSCCCHNYC